MPLAAWLWETWNEYPARRHIDMKAIFLMLAMMFILPPFAIATEEREWREVRRQLERQGVRVDHFARTPSERERELRMIRLQLERRNDPAPRVSMQRIGG